MICSPFYSIVLYIRIKRPERFLVRRDLFRTLNILNITIHTLSLKKGSRITLEGTRIPTVDEVSAMLDYAAPALWAAGFAPY